jgi:hypothetical protein
LFHNDCSSIAAADKLRRFIPLSEALDLVLDKRGKRCDESIRVGDIDYQRSGSSSR